MLQQPACREQDFLHGALAQNQARGIEIKVGPFDRVLVLLAKLA